MFAAVVLGFSTAGNAAASLVQCSTVGSGVPTLSNLAAIGSGATSGQCQAGDDINGFILDFTPTAGGDYTTSGTPTAGSANRANILASFVYTAPASPQAASTLEVTFAPNAAANFSWSPTVGGVSSAQFHIHYDIIPLNPAYGLIRETYSAANAFSSFYIGGVTGDKQANSRATSLPLLTTTGDYETLTSATVALPVQLSLVSIEDSLNLANFGTTVPPLSLVSKVGDNSTGHHGSITNTLIFEPVPEPMTMVLLGCGLLLLAGLHRKLKAAKNR